MYLDYFGLEREPFTISPDPAFLYPSPQHRKALAHLKYGLDREGGFILLTGEVGTGKTTLTRLLLEQLPGNVRVAYILNAKLNSRDVLASICSELHLDYASDSSDKTLTDLIYKDLLAAHAIGKKTLLVLEEAQNLDPDVLETLRLLTNLETNTTKLLHILLVGQPELLDLIARNELRQLNQRVVSRFHIEPLGLTETGNYISHRLRRAGGSKQPFEQSSVKALHQLSGGIPRMINLIGERALLGAYATGSHEITQTIVKAAYKEVFGEALPSDSAPEKNSNNAIYVTVLIGLISLSGYFAYQTLYVSSSGSSRLADEDFEIEHIVRSASGGVIESHVPAEPNSAGAGFGISQPEAGIDVVIDKAVQVADLEGSQLITEKNDVQIIEQSSANAYQQLLRIWGFDGDIQSQQQFCEQAREYGMRCQQDERLSYEDLLLINRPGLVVLAETQESTMLYLLKTVQDSEVVLSNSAGDISVPLQALQDKWTGDFLYLWRPPAPYEDLLYPGTSSPEMVNWVQQQLGKIYNAYEFLLVGGIYTDPISSHVAEFQRSQGLKPDGLLGPRTILRLMDQTEDLPKLVGKRPAANKPADELVYN